MSDRHVVVGAGPVGRHVAGLLAERGSEVVVVTRSGSGPDRPDVARARVDASDPDALAAVVEGASTLYNCANPRDYTQWEEVWPPLATSLLDVAERTGAVYAITGNLYPYGPVDGPMPESTPDDATHHKGVLRARMWGDAKALHDAGRIRAVEVRGSDYVGPGVGDNGHVTRQLSALAAGRTCRVVGRADQPHTFTDVLDVARLLVAAADDTSAHGRTWHVPSNSARTQTEVLTDVAEALGAPRPTVRAIPSPLMRVAARFSAMAREINELAYQWDRPYVLDDQEARRHFGMLPSPWEDVVRRTAAG